MTKSRKSHFVLVDDSVILCLKVKMIRVYFPLKEEKVLFLEIVCIPRGFHNIKH